MSRISQERKETLLRRYGNKTDAMGGPGRRGPGGPRGPRGHRISV